MILATHDLTPTAKRGTLIYMTSNYDWKKVEGWFHLHGNTVVRRKIGGRNTYALCGSEMVMDFITYKEEGTK
jgi:hypothetical protein